MCTKNEQAKQLPRFEIINSAFVGKRSVIIIFDVQFPGLGITLNNLTLESQDIPGTRLGFPRGTVRKRLPKHRQELRLALIPELERAIWQEAEYEVHELNERRRKAVIQQAKSKPKTKTTGGFVPPTDKSVSEEDDHAS